MKNPKKFSLMEKMSNGIEKVKKNSKKEKEKQ